MRSPWPTLERLVSLKSLFFRSSDNIAMGKKLDRSSIDCTPFFPLTSHCTPSPLCNCVPLHSHLWHSAHSPSCPQPLWSFSSLLSSPSSPRNGPCHMNPQGRQPLSSSGNPYCWWCSVFHVHEFLSPHSRCKGGDQGDRTALPLFVAFSSTVMCKGCCGSRSPGDLQGHCSKRNLHLEGSAEVWHIEK